MILTAGYWEFEPGGTYEYGLDPTKSIGIITPNTFNGITILYLYTGWDSGSSSFTTYFLLGGSHSQSVFTSIAANGNTLLSAGVTNYHDYGTQTLWYWEGSNVFTATINYPVVIT